MKIRLVELSLGTIEKLDQNISYKIRGYIGNYFKEDSFMHNHEENGKQIYRYPLIQYKIINGIPLLIGIENGVDSVWNIFNELLELKLGNDEYEIFEKKSLLKQADLGISTKQIFFYFITPWLALNENNYDKYQRLGSWQERKHLLEKILAGNILSISKSLNYTVPELIKVNIKHMKQILAGFKDISMHKFIGSFSVNFEIPDYWGIGKSVSRGFGTIKRIEEHEELNCG